MWQKKVLNRPISSRDGIDLGVIADVTFWRMASSIPPRNNDPLEQIDAIDGAD
jgi:hypothetical protein